MTGAKKILITTETHEQFVLRVAGGKRAFGSCRECGGEVEMLTVDQAVSTSGVRTLGLIALAETGKLHTMETSSGHLLFCRNSIDRFSGRHTE